MQLTPRYGTAPLISLDGDPASVGIALLRQQRRLVDALGSLSEDQWAAPSRCDGWSARDVMVHLESATAFWVVSLAQGLAGEPSRFLADFDPVATPAQMVAASELDGPGVLGRFDATVTALARAVSELDPVTWNTIVEAPPGHVTAAAMAHHALWDSWVHERDVLIPLGRAVTEEPDEVAAALRYVAALSPAFAVSSGRSAPAVMAVDTTDPDVAFDVVVGDRVTVVDGTGTAGSDGVRPGTPDVRLSGAAVALLEALSLRTALPAGAVEVTPGAAWMVDGLTEVFDQT